MNLSNETSPKGIRDGIIATLNQEIRERQEIVSALEGDRLEKFRAIYAKKQAAAMEQSINAQAEALYGDRPTHGDAIAEVRGKKKAGKGDLSADFLAVVKATPGKRAEEIAKALGVDKLPMVKIREALKGKLKMKGKRRGTTYFAK